MPSSETILLEAPLVDHAPPVVTKNPFKTVARKTKPATNQPRLVGTVQLVVRKHREAAHAGEAARDDGVQTTHFLRFRNVSVSNEKNWPLYVLLSRATAPLGLTSYKKKRSASDEALLRALEAQGEVVPLDIGPGGQWVGAQMPESFEQPIFVYDPLVFSSIAIGKPSAARPPTVLPEVVAHGVFSSYLPPEKTAAEVQSDLDALAAKLQSTVMELDHTALGEDDQLDLDVLQRNARELFRLFDEDKSDSIDFGEYKQMLAYRGLNILDSKAMRLFQLVDDQKKGFIDEREFVIALYITNSLRAAAKKQSSQQPGVLSPVDIFYQLDSDRDGLLNRFEYERAMQLLGITRDASAVKASFPKGASVITMEQFKAAWLELIDVREELRKRGITARSTIPATKTPHSIEPITGEPPVTRFSNPFLGRSKKRRHEQQQLKRALMEWINQVEEDELAQAMKAKDEVCRLEKARREQAQEEKRALFAQQRHTETVTRTNEALRERQEKIQRRKERVLKERQAREEKRLVAQMAEEQTKRELHQRQVVQELMATKIERIELHRAKHGDDVLDLSLRRLEEIPAAFYKGRDAIHALSSLLIMILSGNRIRQLPSAMFTHLFALQALDVSDNELEYLPSEIGEARDLRALDIRHNCLVEVPPQIKLLRSLQVLNLAHNALQGFGDYPTKDSVRRESYCKGLEALEDLDLSYNPSLTSIAEAIGELQSLQVFRLRGCTALKKLPDACRNLKSLVIFDVSASQQKRIGKHVFGSSLINLRQVDLSLNSFSSLPEALGKVPNLQDLNVANNALMVFPECATMLKELTAFHGAKNKMESLPRRIGQLIFLEVLDLSRNVLRSPLPPEIGLLTNLHILNLEHNRLSEIPMEMGALINVRDLNLSWNDISQLPEEIGCMASLTKVNLSHNKLAALPDAIVLWQELEMFVCSHNAIKTPLTPSIEHLRRLEYLDLSFNQLSSFDPCLVGLPAVRVLNLSGNKLTFLPRELENAPAGRSLKKLDLYHNKIAAIPVEWTGLLSRLDVFSIGRNPMALLPEKWSDHWRSGRWQRGDVHATASMNGYTPAQVNAWVHDTSVIFPSIVAIWKQGVSANASDAFVDSVRSAMGSDVWEIRYERIVRHYYYEFKYLGHEVVFESISEDQRTAFTSVESRLRDEQTQRADAAIAENIDFRAKLARAYHFDGEDHHQLMHQRRRAHEERLLVDMQHETQQLNEIVRGKLPGAVARHDLVVYARKKQFADDMKAIARRRVHDKQRLQEQLPSPGDVEVRAE